MNKPLFISALVAVGLMSAVAVHAMTPTLSLYSSGNSDAVQITVYGDTNASVYLYYQKSGYSTQSQYLGMTGYNGYLYTTVSTSSLGVSSGSSVYVTVNGQQSSSATWPSTSYYYGGGSLMLSPSNVTVNVGQSTNVTVSGGSMPYSMYPMTQNIFQGILSGNTLTITGLAAGSSTLSVCSSGGSSCSTLSVSVTNQYNYNYYPNYYPNNYTGSIYYPYQNQDGWTFCASENQQCTINGTQTVRYGANGRYAYRTVTGSVWCSNATFGDPAYGAYKQCSYGGAAPYSDSYSGVNAYTFTRALAYGSWGEDVKELQRRLQSEDFYGGSISGYFGTMTRAALKRYQMAHDLPQSGRVDSATMMVLNGSY